MKKQVRVYRDSISIYDFDGTLANIKERVDSLYNQYGPDAVLDYGQHEMYSTSYSYALYVMRDETDAEYNQRLADQRAHKKDAEERERKLFVELQEKYGTK